MYTCRIHVSVCLRIRRPTKLLVCCRAVKEPRSYPQEKKGVGTPPILHLGSFFGWRGLLLEGQNCEEVRRGVSRDTLFPVIKLGLLIYWLKINLLMLDPFHTPPPWNSATNQRTLFRENPAGLGRTVLTLALPILLSDSQCLR